MSYLIQAEGLLGEPFFRAREFALTGGVRWDEVLLAEVFEEVSQGAEAGALGRDAERFAVGFPLSPEVPLVAFKDGLGDLVGLVEVAGSVAASFVGVASAHAVGCVLSFFSGHDYNGFFFWGPDVRFGKVARFALDAFKSPQRRGLETLPIHLARWGQGAFKSRQGGQGSFIFHPWFRCVSCGVHRDRGGRCGSRWRRFRVR